MGTVAEIRPGDFILEPAILVRVVEDETETRVETATLGEGDEKALLVFSTGEEAIKFQEATGKCTREEGYYIVSDKVAGGAKIVASALEKTGAKQVVMPEPWTGDSGAATFEAENFLRLLDERWLA